jgi:predicted PurR-regulated permease PerM
MDAVIMIAIGIGAILVFGKDVIVHIALAVILSFILAPIVRKLQSVGLHRGLAVTASLLAALSIILAVVYVVYWQVATLAIDLPNYQNTLRQKVHDISVQISSRGIFSKASDVVGQVVDDVQKIGNESKAPPAIVATVAQPEQSALESVYSYIEPLLEPVATLFVVMLLSAFMLAQREDLRNRFIRLAGTDDIQQTTFALDDAGTRVSRMLLSQLVINTAFGTVIAIGLYLIGVPSPLLWGIFAGIMRFVPYIGAIIGALPPMLAAFAFDPTWTSLLLTIGLFLFIEPIVGHIIEPLVYGHNSGLSPIAIIISATIWAALWGPIGLVLSTPITICLVVIGRHVKRLGFLDILLGDKPALEPHEIFYQRMLAGDPAEATSQARAFLTKRSLPSYYDHIALEAMRRAHNDTVRVGMEKSHVETLVQSTRTLVQSLADTAVRRVGRRKRSAETEAAWETTRPDQHFDITPARGADAEKDETPVIGILYGSDPLDQVVAEMLKQVFDKYGYRSSIASIAQKTELSAQDASRLQLVCLCFIEPLSTLHLRAFSIATRKCARNAKVMLCLWQKTDQFLTEELRRKVRVDKFVTSITEALLEAKRIISGKASTPVNQPEPGVAAGAPLPLSRRKGKSVTSGAGVRKQ